MNLDYTIKFIVALIIMMNPLGAVSIFLNLTSSYSLKEKRKTAVTSTIAVTAIMLLSTWIGKGMLDIFGITIPSFRMTGGIILLLMGLSMLQSHESPIKYNKEDDQVIKPKDPIAIVPISLPLIVGPGVISTIIIAINDYPSFYNKLYFSAICVFLSLLVGLLLYYANLIEKICGRSGIRVITRIMGMLLMAIALGMISDGIKGLFPVLSLGKS